MSSETFNCYFCSLSQNAPLWLLKRQDIYVSFTNFWSLISTDGGKKWKTEQPPHNIKWVSGLGNVLTRDILPIIQQSKRAAAAQLCLQERWEWQSQDSGSFADFADPLQRGGNLISWLLFFQKYQQCRFCCFKFRRFTHDDAVPRRVHLYGGFLLYWWGKESPS